MTMEKHPRTLLVLITEAALEKRLIAESLGLGAHGYTVHDVRGGSQLGTREALWEADRSIEMQLICSPEVADAIARAQTSATGQADNAAEMVVPEGKRVEWTETGQPYLVLWLVLGQGIGFVRERRRRRRRLVAAGCA